MFPDVLQIQQLDTTTTTTQETTTLGSSFLFDFTAGDFLLINGRLVKATDVDALKVWIEKELRTEKFKFKIYEKPNRDSEYGVTIQDLIVGQSYSQSFVKSELQREITQALLKNPLIQSITNWDFTRLKSTLIVSFEVVQSNGTTFYQEVTFNAG